MRTRRTRGGCGGRAAGMAAEGPVGAVRPRERAREGEGRRRDGVAAAWHRSSADGAQHVHEESCGGEGSPGSKRSTTNRSDCFRLERPLAGQDSHLLGGTAFPRRTETSGLAGRHLYLP